MQSDSSATCARFLESQSFASGFDPLDRDDCGAPEYAVSHNYRSIDSFRRSGAMKTYFADGQGFLQIL